MSIVQSIKKTAENSAKKQKEALLKHVDDLENGKKFSMSSGELAAMLGGGAATLGAGGLLLSDANGEGHPVSGALLAGGLGALIPHAPQIQKLLGKGFRMDPNAVRGITAGVSNPDIAKLVDNLNTVGSRTSRADASFTKSSNAIDDIDNKLIDLEDPLNVKWWENRALHENEISKLKGSRIAAVRSNNVASGSSRAHSNYLDEADSALNAALAARPAAAATLRTAKKEAKGNYLEDRTKKAMAGSAAATGALGAIAGNYYDPLG